MKLFESYCSGDNKMKKLLTFFAMFTIVLARAYDVSEWQVRPWEIIKGLKPQGKTLWQLDKDGLDSLECTGADAVLSVTESTKLWGEHVVKMTFPKGGEVQVSFTTPIPVTTKADGIELWLYGPYQNGPGSNPVITFDITDSNGKKINIKTCGGGTRWNSQRWWGVAAGILPKDIAFPISVNGFNFQKLLTTTPDDFLCFDMLGAWNYTGELDNPDVFKMKLPFPTTKDTIMPTSAAPGGKVTLSNHGNDWIFQYKDKSSDVRYVYTPNTGTLGDISAAFGNTPAFQPAKDGGPVAANNGISLKPGDSQLSPKLVKCIRKGDKLIADWILSKNGQSIDVSYILSMKGKTLVVEISSKSQGITQLDAGIADGIQPGSQLFALTYLNNRWDYPRFLATPNFLMSVFADWYESNASYYSEGNGYGGFQPSQIISDTSARILGGTIYSPLTDGTYVPFHERLFFTISDKLEEILPNIPHPASPYRDEMIRTVCISHFYALQGRNNDVDEELRLWRNMTDYGMNDLFVRYHALFRTPLANNRLSLCLDAGMSNGGDEPTKRLLSELRKIINRVGVYQDNRIIAPNDPIFHYDLASIQSNNVFLPGWDNCFRPKPASMLKIYQDFLPKFTSKYSVNAEYLDELTNAPQWADVDFDAKQPGAGRFAQVHRAYGAVSLLNRKLIGGPIWSEGCAAYLWAGLLDVDYAVSNDHAAGLPLIVDYKLRKMNTKSVFTGADWPILQGYDTDLFISTEIAEGNIGFLARGGDFPGAAAMPQQGRAANFKTEYYGNTLKSYFMMRQYQETALSSEVEEIKYNVDGTLMTASQMLMSGKTSQNRIYERFSNGLEVWINRAANGNWCIEVDGTEYILPPNGHFARKPGTLTQYTILLDGHRVDYSKGPLYTYVNANGTVTSFPEITCKGAYLLRKVAGGTLLTPQPFLESESITGLKANKVQPLKQDRTPLEKESTLDLTSNGLGTLVTRPDAFHYRIK